MRRLALAFTLAPALAGAQTAASVAAPAKPVPYSLPWLLRPAAPATVVRIDQTMAFYEDPVSGRSGSTYVTGLAATWRLSPRWVPVVRALWVKNDAAIGPSGSGFANPAVGITYLHPLGRGWRWTAFGASTIPAGSGGGDAPDPGAAAAMAAGIPARSGMDNTLFAVNYWGLVGGLSLARVTPAITLPAEAAVFQLTRVRALDDPMAARGYDIVQVDLPIAC